MSRTEVKSEDVQTILKNDHCSFGQEYFLTG